jgi:hypothetical protein
MDMREFSCLPFRSSAKIGGSLESEVTTGIARGKPKNWAASTDARPDRSASSAFRLTGTHEGAAQRRSSTTNRRSRPSGNIRQTAARSAESRIESRPSPKLIDPEACSTSRNARAHDARAHLYSGFAWDARQLSGDRAGNQPLSPIAKRHVRPSNCGRVCGIEWLRPGAPRSGSPRLQGRQWSAPL